MKNSFLAVLAILAGCSPQIRVYSDQDPDHQVSNYRTFDWGQKGNVEAGRNPVHYNELNDKRIKTAVFQELRSRGYSLSEQHPDMIIHYHIVVDEQSVVTTEPFGYTYGPYWTRMRTHVYSYREGTLIIDLMDPKTNALIWRGWASADLNTIAPNRTEEVINRAVAKIFKRFPHSGKSAEPVVSTTNSN